jgi:hypothetical protein
VNVIAFLVAAAMALGLSRRVLGGSNRVTLAVIVATALAGLYVTELRH